MKTRSIVAAGLGATLLVLGGSLMFSLRPESPAQNCPTPLDLHRVRALAASLAGDKAKEVRVEPIMAFKMPEALVRAGGQFRLVTMTVLSYQVVFDNRTLVVDVGMAQSQANGPLEYYDNHAWQRVTHAMDNASAIYATHEHCDHVGGLFVAGEKPYRNARLTPEQMASPERTKPAVITDAARAAVQPLVYQDMVAVAPGVVLMKAAGHTPGSQWVYIKQRNGTEMLLLGDTAWQMSNIQSEQGPPGLLTLMLKDDHHATACQLQSLDALAHHETQLHLVPGHDAERVQELVEHGVLTAGFL